MNPILSICPVCSEQLSVTRLECRTCDTVIEGQFELGRLGRLDPEQIAFVETFIRCEGKLNRMEPELGMSYPTLRSRLLEVIQALGFPVGTEDPGMSEEARHHILDELADGKISSAEAMSLLEAD